MFGFKTIKTFAAVATLAMSGWAGAASAATVTSIWDAGTCAVSDVTSGGSNSTACFGTVEPTPINTALIDPNTVLTYSNYTDYTNGTNSTTGMFGYTDWTEASTVIPPSSSWTTASSGDLTIGSDGSWSWSGVDLTSYDHVMIMLKQGNTFSAYLLDPASGNSGTWETTVAAFGNNAGGLSHFVLYVGDPVAPVPLPAGGLLLMGALGGLGLVKRRRRKAA